MIVYADTSALAKLVLQEPGSAEIQQVAMNADALASAAIAYVELRAAIAAAIHQGRIAEALRSVHVAELEQLWARLSEIPVDHLLLRRAGELAERMALRGYDAVHLAAMIEAGTPDAVGLACWDVDLRRAASELGYTLVPA